MRRSKIRGALKIFTYKNGVLANRFSIAPGAGFGYQVRHLDFHPSGKWVFVTPERQNQIIAFTPIAAIRAAISTNGPEIPCIPIIWLQCRFPAQRRLEDSHAPF
ncbi:MAG: hypothetical protein ABSG41_27240 [Bryobacteraceae bacterium]